MQNKNFYWNTLRRLIYKVSGVAEITIQNYTIRSPCCTVRVDGQGGASRVPIISHGSSSHKLGKTQGNVLLLRAFAVHKIVSV